MKRLFPLLLCSATLACATDLAAVHSVYILPMSHGLDQYLANRITNSQVFTVVTDPKLAEAVFTEQIGANFETRMTELFPPPETVAPPAPKADADAQGEDEGEPKGEPKKDSMAIGDTVNKLANPAQNSSFGRSKGTLFLVDAKSRQVIWSTYETPNGSRSTNLDHTASDIVDRIKRELKSLNKKK
jgi:hypothetical protein